MNRKLKFFGVIVISIATVLAFTSFWNDSFTYDEIAHVGAGYSYVTAQEYRLNPEHPPLAKDLAGWMMTTFLDINDESAYDSAAWKQDLNGQWDFGRSLIYNSENNVDAITRLVKTSMLLFFILAAIFIFKWTHELYGPRASAISLILFSFSPTVLAHSRFVNTDIPALFGVLAASYFFFKYLKNQNGKNLIIAGLVFGLAQLLKFSVFLLVPYFLVVALIYAVSYKKWKVILATIAIMVIGFLGVVWPWYGWHVTNYAPEKQHSDAETALNTYGNRYFADPIVYLSDKPFVRGLAQYGLGVLLVNQRVSGGHTVYFWGNIEGFGNPYYFPVVYFLKESLAYWLLALIALLYLFRENATFGFKKHFTEIMMLLWIASYWVISVRSNLNIGVRHLLVVYPFTIILISGLLGGFLKNNVKPKLILLAGLLSWYTYETVHVHPAYLSYFNQVAGGPSGGRYYVVDSNLDWGQDLKRLSQWAEKNNVQNINLDYFGQADTSYYLGDKLTRINSTDYRSKEDFLRANPNGGYMAISTSFYMGTRGDPEQSYAWLDQYEPVVVIGNSIFVWKFDIN